MKIEDGGAAFDPREPLDVAACGVTGPDDQGMLELNGDGFDYRAWLSEVDVDGLKQRFIDNRAMLAERRKEQP